MVALYYILETIAVVGTLISALCFTSVVYGLIIIKSIRYNLVRYVGLISLTISVGAIFILCVIFNKWLQWIPALILGPVAIYLWIRDFLRTNERLKCSKESQDLGLLE